MKAKRWLLVLAALALLLPAAPQAVSAQTRSKKTQKSAGGQKRDQSFVLKAQRAEGDRGSATDPNIKNDSTTNSEQQEAVGPESKGGSSDARGAAGLCRVEFDNYTRWIVKVYVDGTFRGVVGPYGEGTSFTLAGPTRVYARADFDNGSYLYWGPKDYSCRSGQYIYFKMDP